MRILEHFKEKLITVAMHRGIFYTSRTLPSSNQEKYWYNRGLQDSLEDVRLYEKSVDDRYSKGYLSLISALSNRGIEVSYDESSGVHHLVMLRSIDLAHYSI